MTITQPRCCRDTVADDGERFTLTLSNATGADIRDGDAVGTIRDMPVAGSGPLTGFMLVDGSSGTDLGAITGGAALTLPDPHGGYRRGRTRCRRRPTRRTATRTDDAAPYELFGTGQALPAGAYTMRALAYAAAARGGDVLQTLTASFTVKEPLTAALEDVPAEHDGSPFSFRVRFSEGVPTTDAALLAAFKVTGGTATASRRVGGADDLREIDVEPTRAATDVTVDYATQDSDAKAGSDYTAASDTLEFAAGTCGSGSR